MAHCLKLPLVPYMSLFTRKPVYGICGVRLKAACSVSETSCSVELLDLHVACIILPRQRKTKVLIRLCRCTGWSAPLLFAYDIRHVFVWPGSCNVCANSQGSGETEEQACLSFPYTINGPRQANLVLIAYASSEGSGEPAHPRSLARTFAARSYKQWVKRNLQTESQIPGPSEWLGMRS